MNREARESQPSAKARPPPSSDNPVASHLLKSFKKIARCRPSGPAARRRNEQTVAYNIYIPAGAGHGSRSDKRQHGRISRDSNAGDSFRDRSDKSKHNADNDTGPDINSWYDNEPNHNPHNSRTDHPDSDSRYDHKPDGRHYNHDARR